MTVPTETRPAFTPGPWNNSGMVLGRGPEARFWDIQGGEERRLVAQVRRSPDAQLITAAPDLYEVVAYLVSQEQHAYVFSRDTLAKMRAALAKADGR